MKKYHYILFCLFVLVGGSWLLTPSVYADNFVDDIYYNPKQVLLKTDTTTQVIKPIYDKNIREIVFITDTLQTDTVVRAIIR